MKRCLFIFNLCLVFSVLLITKASALTPPYEGPQTMTQPSGEQFTCYMQFNNGQSFWTYENTDMVIIKNENGYWCFAKLFDEPKCSSAKCKIDKPQLGTMLKADMILWLQSHPRLNISFKVSGQIGDTIYNSVNHTITFNMPKGTDVTALTPNMSWGIPGHSGIATPGDGVAQDFSEPVIYTVNYYDYANTLVDTETWTVNCMLYEACTKVNVFAQEFFDDNNNAVFDLIPNENIHLSLGVSSVNEMPCSAIFAAVLYDEHNIAKDIKIINKLLYNRSSLQWVNITLLLPDDTRGHYIKIFCFDSANGLKPLMTPIKRQQSITNGVKVIPRVAKGDTEWELNMTIVNYTNQQATINNTSSQKYDFVLLDASRNELYRWSTGKAFTAETSTTSIGAGQKIEYSERISKAQYLDIISRAIYMKAYITGTSNDFTINTNGYEIMVDEPRPLKPNIYLYPLVKQPISVQVEPSGYITKSIPYYEDGWNFDVTPEGKIDGQYDYLFYEAVLNSSLTLDKGWVLEKESFESSMQDILTRIGLNDKEKQDFLEYWNEALTWPNKYYAAYLITPDEIDKAIPLTINPKPESLLRTFFYFVPMDNKIELQEPSIQLFERSGYSAVEWGGMKE